MCKGEANSKGRHGTSREMIWISVDHGQIADQRIITWRIAQHTNNE